MLPKTFTSDLVEQLAEAEQSLASGSSENSAAASEERDTVAEATAAASEDRDRSSNPDSRSECSDGGRRHLLSQGFGSGSSIGSRGSSKGTSSLDDSSLSERLATFLGGDEDPGQPSLVSLTSWQQRVRDSQEANRVAEAKLRKTELKMESMEGQKNDELREMRRQLDSAEKSVATDLRSRELGEENRRLKNKLQASEQQEEVTESVMETMRRNAKTIQRNHMDEITNLKIRLDSGMSADDFHQSMSRQLETSRITNGGMMNELAELRLKLANADKLRQHEVGDLQMMLDTASFKLELSELGETSSSSASATHVLSKSTSVRRKGHPRKGSNSLPKLDAIEEDCEDSESNADTASSHFNVSSDAGSSISNSLSRSDVEGSDEGNAIGKDAKGQKRQVVQDSTVDIATREATYESRMQYLTEQLESARKTHALTSEKLEAARRVLAWEGAGRESQLESLSWLLGVARAGGGAESEADQRSEISHALEAKRIAEVRAEDLRLAMASQERKHRKEKEELMQRQKSAGDNSDDANDKQIDEIKAMLKGSQEEKNVLINTFECKEIQWKTQIENMQLEMDEMRRRHERVVRKLEPEIQATEVSAKEGHKAKSATQSLWPPDPESASVFRWLRCPVRGPQGPRPTFCQEICWKVLSAISGAVVLWCSGRDFTVQDASREANRIWGSCNLEGKSIFSLASGPSSASWLKKAFQSHQRMADMETGELRPPGFLVRDLGCESFMTKGGDMFDCSVITAHFPPEVVCSRQAAFLIILDPQDKFQHTTPATRASTPRARSSLSQRGPGSHARLLSPQSDVSASSVTPDDSASNIL